MAVDLKEIEQTVEAMRRLGIRVLASDALRLELDPPPLDPNATPVVNPPRRCNCPHDEAAHQDGICLEGCDPSECAGKGVSRGR